LIETVDAFLSAARTEVGLVPKALIVPHAGYIYSGPIAGSAFRTVLGRTEIQRVALIGPSHYAEFQGLVLPQVGAFETPLGCAPVDTEALGALEPLKQVRVFNGPHEPEHSLEVEIPFVQRALAAAQIVPLLVGEAKDEEVAEVIDMLWGGPETLLIISSDLSHFLPYERAQARDTETAQHIVELRAECIRDSAACGSRAIRGLLLAARRRDASMRLLDLRNSGDTAGPSDRVVGYGAFALMEGL
jgi:AmmeMemoRadiSam system protein B